MNLHPQNWLTQFKPLQNVALAPDETVGMVMHYEATDLEENQTNHIIFAVIRKGNQAIGRTLVCHEHKDESFCTGHGMEFASYPIEDENALIEEVAGYGLGTLKKIANGESSKLKVNGEKNTFLVKSPKNTTNNQLLQAFYQDKNPEGNTAKAVILGIFGLLGNNQPQQNHEAIEISPLSPIPALADKNLEATNNLKKAAEEQELIKRFGKAKIEKLAKAMNYQGEIINKTKLKSHVSTN